MNWGSWEFIATIVSAVFGSQVLVTFVQGLFGRKKDSEDHSLRMIEAQGARIDKLEKDLETLRQLYLEAIKENAYFKAKLELHEKKQ